MLKLSHLVVQWNYADRCNLIENRNSIWSKLITQYCGLQTNEFGPRTEACVNFTIGLFFLAGRSSAALEVNGKGKGRILNNGKGNVAEGKGNIAEIEFKYLLINSISGTVSRVDKVRILMNNIRRRVYPPAVEEVACL